MYMQNIILAVCPILSNIVKYIFTYIIHFTLAVVLPIGDVSAWYA